MDSLVHVDEDGTVLHDWLGGVTSLLPDTVDGIGSVLHGSGTGILLHGIGCGTGTVEGTDTLLQGIDSGTGVLLHGIGRGTGTLLKASSRLPRRLHCSDRVDKKNLAISKKAQLIDSYAN